MEPPLYKVFEKDLSKNLPHVPLLSRDVKERFLTSSSLPVRLSTKLSVLDLQRTSAVDSSPTASTSCSLGSIPCGRNPPRRRRRVDQGELSPPPAGSSRPVTLTSDAPQLLSEVGGGIIQTIIKPHETAGHKRCHHTTPSSSVELYVYDLSKGVLERIGDSLLGRALPGVYHSSVVCYGMEFYFEGGIGSGRAGSTRFGRKFFRIPLGSTDIPLPDFLRWLRVVEQREFQLVDYHMMNWNCHNFSLTASEFLLGKGTTTIPEFLFQTTADAFETPIGKIVLDIVHSYMNGLKFKLLQSSIKGIEENREGMIKIQYAALRNRIQRSPKPTVVCFRVVKKETALKTICAVTFFLQQMVIQKVVQHEAVEIPERFAAEVTSSSPTWDTKVILMFTDAVVIALLHTPQQYWGPLFNALRLAILNKAALPVVLHHPHVLRLTFAAVQDFPRLSCDGKIGLLRFVCNFASSVHGAVLLCKYKFLSHWTSLVGLALLDPSEMVNYTGACLALNIILSMKFCHRTPFLEEMCRVSTQHVMFRLTETLLYSLHPIADRRLSEPTTNMLLMALMYVKATSLCTSQFVDCHRLTPKFSYLLRYCKSSETASLICLVRSL